MRTRCPCCGTTLSLDALVAHEDARAALVSVFALGGPLGSAVVRYLALWRPAQNELSMGRVAKILAELLPDIQAQRITTGGQVFDVPPEAWVWAIEQSIAAHADGRLKTPLKSHGWLYAVLASWRPTAAAVLTQGAAPAARSSRTVGALAALEELKR
jgi:hypothetical protein